MGLPAMSWQLAGELLQKEQSLHGKHGGCSVQRQGQSMHSGHGMEGDGRSSCSGGPGVQGEGHSKAHTARLVSHVYDTDRGQSPRGEGRSLLPCSHTQAQPLSGDFDPLEADFWVMREADVLLISNSTLSFSAALLSNRRGAVFMRPDACAGGFVGFDPWRALPILPSHTVPLNHGVYTHGVREVHAPS